MNKDRLAKKASQLRIASHTIAHNMKNGNFKSLYRGQGIEFSGVREYLPDDNVRAIDWNVTARMGKPYIKQYEEDRELSVFIILDCSSSMKMGSKEKTRFSTAQEITALILLAAEHNHSSNGAVFFDGNILFSCPPQSGRENTMMILSKLDKIDEEEFTNGSVLQNAIKGASMLLKKRSLVFVISDFKTDGYQDDFARLAQKHDVVALKITDACDSELPAIGTLPVFDIESSKKSIFPTSSKKFRFQWFEHNSKKNEIWKEFCTKHGALAAFISTEEDCVSSLSKIFSRKRK